MTIAAPRVYIHDASFKRLGRLSHVSSISRSFTLDNKDVAAFTVGYDEPLYRDLRPALGRVIVIESSSFPMPWVGKLVSVKGDRSKRTVACSSKGYASIFDNRVLGPSFTGSGTASSVISQALRDVNLFGQTGVRWGGGGSEGGTGATAALQINAPNQRARVVFDRATRFGGLEWYIDAEPSPGTIDLQLRVPKWRGVDAFNQYTLQDGVNGNVSSWTEDGESAAFAMVVVSSFESATQSVNDRPVARLAMEAATIGAPHGYSIDGSEIPANILTRQERVIVSEELKAAGSASAGAAALLAKEGGVVRRSIRIESTSAPDWPFFAPGNVVRVASEQAFGLDGFDGPARVLAVQPKEEAGKLAAVVQILRERPTSD